MFRKAIQSVISTPQYTTILLKAFQAGVPIAVEKQQSIIQAVKDGRTPGENEGVRKKPDGSKVTPGDIESQRAIIQTIVDEFAFINQKVAAVAEEEGLDQINDLVDEADANFRVVVDPIDGTGNFSMGLRSNLSETKLGCGWGSMIAIQKREGSHPNSWTTVASGIYESTSLDNPKTLHGKVYMASEEFAGIKTFNFTDSTTNTLNISERNSKAYLSGGFVQRFVGVSIALETKLQHADKEKVDDLKCVAHSILAVINGYVGTYFQGHPYIHDVAATAYLAKAAGLYVIIMPEIARKPDAIKKDAFPFIVSDDAEIANALVTVYCHEMGYDIENLIVKNGSMEEKQYRREEVINMALVSNPSLRKRYHPG